tara:strand:+ start:232 stop:420 length:189 start_codon:yes stop_codon:yes gene_type:complete
MAIPVINVSCNRCGGEISASEFDTDNYVCLVLSCNDCNTIVDKVWKNKQSRKARKERAGLDE